MLFMKRFAFTLPFLIMLAGCQWPSFVGSWTTEVDSEAGKIPATLDIKQDGTWSGTVTTRGASTPVGDIPGMGLTASGTWKVDGENLSFEASKATILDPTPLVKMFPGVVEDKLKTDLNKWGEAKIKFPNGNSAELTLKTGDKVTFNRVVK